MSNEPTTLHAALVAAQAEMPALQRDKINPAFRSQYLSLEGLLEGVLPILNKHGLAVAQFPTFVPHEGELVPALRTVLIHGATGATLEDTMLLMLAKRDPQGQGSGITYAKRYALCALLGISADADDDGNAATGRAAQRQTRTPAKAVITEAKRQELFAKVRDLQIASSRAKEIIKTAAGVDDSAKIPAAKFAAVMDALAAERVAA
jgi:hypothetical protein